MSDALSAVAFRILGARDRLTGTPRDSLENIITNTLPDGSWCWVTSQTEFYVFSKAATAPPFVVDGVNVVAPIGGPGLWFRYSFLLNLQRGLASLHFFSVPGITLTNTGVNITQPFAGVGLAFTLQSPQNFTEPVDGVLQYNGTLAKRFIVTASASIAWASTPTGPFGLLLAQATPPGAFADLDSEALIECEATSTNIAKHVTVRRSVELNPGDQIRMEWIDRSTSTTPTTFVAHSLALAVGE